MAVIGNIRKRSGLLVAVVGIALAAFVLGDFLTGNTRSIPDVGKIAGETITYREFEFKFDEYLNMVQEQSPELNFTNEQIYEMKQEVWRNLVRETLLEKELKATGITVTADELFELVQGRNPHPYIYQSFSDPQTGMFNPAIVVNFMQTLDQREPEVRRQWYRLEKSIIEERLNTKYTNLIRKGYYVPDAFAKRDYIDKNKAVDINFVLLPFRSIPDEDVTVNKKDLQKAYEKHKHEFYAKEATRTIEYIVFDIIPSEEDRKALEEEMVYLAEEFENTDDIAYFININSDLRYDSLFKKQEQLPLLFDSIIFNAEVGTSIGPLNEGNIYYLARLIEVQNRPDSVKASHILISYEGAFGASQALTRTKEEAEALADSLLNVIKKQPATFEQLAQEFSDDRSAEENNGDLDWFADGMMVHPFNEACFTGKKGDKVKVETDFGFHVIHITDMLAPQKKVKVAIVKRELTPSNDTYQNIYSQASKFAIENKKIEQFEQAVIELGKPKRIAEDMKIMDNNIAGLKSPREIVRWAFNEETKVNSISRIFEIEDKFVIAVLKGMKEKGIPSLETIKDKIEPLAIRHKKAEILEEKMRNAKSSSSSIEQLAQALNTQVEKGEYIRFSSVNLPALGPEPKIIGTAFGLSKGQLSQPIAANNGVFVITVSEVYDAPVLEDYTASKQMLKNFFIQRASFDLNNALEKAYKVEDNRSLFY